MDPRLVALSEAIADADREGEDRYGARALRIGLADDSMAARARGSSSPACGSAPDAPKPARSR